jgi:hypothetical protein
MTITYHISRRNTLQLWIITSAIVGFWAALSLLSQQTAVIPALILLAVICYAIPFIGTFLVYVTVDDEHISVPRAVVFRRQIPIRTITALVYRPHGLGLLGGIIIQYQDLNNRYREALLPAFTAFGTAPTSRLVHQLMSINPRIRVDKRIATKMM